MSAMEEAAELIAVSLVSLKPAGAPGPAGRMYQVAVIRGESSTRELSFRYETCPLNAERIEQCEALKKHGFTVVESPGDWRYWSKSHEHWKSVVIDIALKQVETLMENENGKHEMSDYSAELANAVLGAAQQSFPHQITMVELKKALRPEPSDHALLTAIEALHIDGFIDWHPFRSQLTNELAAVAFIKITAEGRKHLTSIEKPALEHSVILNLGQIGAIGPNSTGEVNTFYASWQRVEPTTDLSVLAAELEKLRCEFRQFATKREDDAQLGVLSEAEYAAESGDGAGVMKALAKVGRSVLETAERIGTDIAAKVIVEASKG
jgi:hypothetical protein